MNKNAQNTTNTQNSKKSGKVVKGTKKGQEPWPCTTIIS